MKPAPYPADTRAKGWRFELDYEKIDQSDTWGLAAAMALDGLPLARPLLLATWYAAWKQTPCGSLPADDRLLAAAIGIPMAVLADYREVLCRGWWQASDGRLYHDTLVDRVVEMMSKRRSDADRQAVKRNAASAMIARDGACVYCGTTEGLTVDHLLSKKAGGDSDPLNLAAACKPCNSKKKERTPEQAGMPIINPAAADRWREYQESRTDFVRRREDSCPTAAGVRPKSSTDHRPPKEHSDADASAGKPAATKPERRTSLDDAARSDLWKAAVDVLQSGGCKAEATCRSFMGKLVGDYTFEVVREAVAIAASNQPADAREYLKAACMRLKGERAQDHGKPLTVPANAAAAAAQAAADAEHRKRAEEIAAITPEQRAETARLVRERAGILKVVS